MKAIKKLRFLTLTVSLLSLLAMLTSCSKDEPAPSLSVDKAALEADGDGDMMKLKVAADGEWSVETDTDWLILHTTFGKGKKEITIEATPSYESDVRKGTVSIVSAGVGARRVDIPVYQNCSDVTETVTLIIGKHGGSRTVELDNIFSNADISVKAKSKGLYTSDGKAHELEDMDWISVSQSGTTLNVDVKALEIPGEEGRIGEITLGKDGKSKKIRVLHGMFRTFETISSEIVNKEDWPLTQNHITELRVDFGVMTEGRDPKQIVYKEDLNPISTGMLVVPVYHVYGEREGKIKSGYYEIDSFDNSPEQNWVQSACSVGKKYGFNGKNYWMQYTKMGPCSNIEEGRGVYFHAITHLIHYMFQIGVITDVLEIYTGCGYYTGAVYIEKVNDAEAYLYLIGGHSFVGILDAGRERIDYGASAYKLKIDAALVE